MRKFFKNSLIAVLASAVVFGSALGIVACGDDENEAFLPYKIGSEAEWAAAMDFSGVTNGTMRISGIGGRIQTCYFDGDKIKEEYTNTDGSESSIRFVEYRTDEPHEDSEIGTQYAYKYNLTTSTWIVEKYGMHDRDTLNDLFNNAVNDNLREYNAATGQYEKKLSERYGDFRFDQSKYAYVASYSKLGDMSNVNVEVKFVDGRLTEGFFTYKSEYDGQNEAVLITFKIYDLSTTRVDLPQAEEE